MTTGGDWARNLASEIKAARRGEELTTERMLEERKIKASHGQKLWDKVKDSFKKSTELLNTELGEDLLYWENAGSSELQIRRNDLSATLNGAYNFQTDEITFESQLFKKPVKYKIRLARAGNVELAPDNGGMAVPPEKIAESVLSKFSKGNFPE